MATVLRGSLHWLTSLAAQAYATPTMDSARRICLRLQEDGFGSTVCFWNGDSDSVEDITRSCLELLDLLRDLDSLSYLSIKLPAMQFNSRAVAVILQAAAPTGRLIHFDSHGPEDADQMFATVEEAMSHHRNLGCTIPGRWLRSIEDARLAVRWGLRVRVVNGQWPDPLDPDMDMRAGFLNVVDELCGRARCVAVASHDVQLARQGLEHLLAAETPCELELLHGLPRRAAITAARQLGVPVRFYVPQGKTWLPYLLKQARKNPRVLGWFARDLISGYAQSLGSNFK
jgi:proline dehydrogenase